MEKIILAILDGVGISENIEGNAVKLSNPKFLNYCFKRFSNTKLFAGEQYVGLPTAQMGNSEVGHINIGAGRVVPQTLFQINNLIDNKNFFSNAQLVHLFKQVQTCKVTLHIVGLLSDGGVHSHINHLFALIEASKTYKINKIALHIILDGRDTAPNASQEFLRLLSEKIKDEKNISIATISGRYFAMDREGNWDRTQLAYDVIANAKGKSYKTYQEFYDSINQKIMDEFVPPFLISGYKGIEQDDVILFSNFRADRMRQICHAFADKQLVNFNREIIESLSIYTLTDYGEELRNFNITAILKEKELKNTLTEVLVKNDLRVLKVAETTKYAHVTYFFNGGREKPFDNEDRILIPSDNITTFDLKPEMQAKKITNAVIRQIKKTKYDSVILNYANGDMVGHSGNLNATIKAVKTVDKELKKLYKFAIKNNYLLIITADHGNAEKMLDEKGGIWTAHTLNKVPFILCSNEYSLLENTFSLANIAPTILDIMNVDIPVEMTAQSMLNKKEKVQKFKTY